MSTERTASRKKRYAEYKAEVQKPFRKFITFAMFRQGLTQAKLMEDVEGAHEASQNDFVNIDTSI